ncbi:MAG: hypothetical protein K6T92_04655 [Candidatus Rokubacteria bacterium]|nr:hypothetical protein [Candidatus Rokubacteria bacterium]
MLGPVADPWAVILAGGAGTRRRALTRRIAGDERPKQFCRLVDGETMIDRTRRRAEWVVRPDRHVVVVTADHAGYFGALPLELAPGRLVVQPCNRGTLVGLLYPILRVVDLAGDAPVVILPSDHDLAEEPAFMDQVAQALEVVRALPERLVLLGIEPEGPEVEYGWIEPGPVPPEAEGPVVFGVRRFWEKPTPALVRALYARRCLWNSFVMVGWASTVLAVARRAAPDVWQDLAPLRRALGTRREPAVARRVSQRLPALSFSAHVLVRMVDRLLVLPVKDVGWADWGHPQRVLASLERRGCRPGWLEPLELAPPA